MIEAQRFAQILRLHEGREAGAQVHGITRRRREQLAIAPDAGRSIGDGVAGEPLPDGPAGVGGPQRGKKILPKKSRGRSTEAPPPPTTPTPLPLLPPAGYPPP